MHSVGWMEIIGMDTKEKYRALRYKSDCPAGWKVWPTSGQVNCAVLTKTSYSFFCLNFKSSTSAAHFSLRALILAACAVSIAALRRV